MMMWQNMFVKIMLYFSALVMALLPYIKGHADMGAYTIVEWFEVCGIVAGVTTAFLTRSPVPREEWTQAERTENLRGK